MSTTPPSAIFLHAMFRAGSTYMFSVFRRAGSRYCTFYEPMHELVPWASEDRERLMLDNGDNKMDRLNHPAMSAPYFQELYDAWPAWQGRLAPEVVYGGYFASMAAVEGEGDNNDTAGSGAAYYRSLIAHCREQGLGMPVFGECRTAGRIGALKRDLAGDHSPLHVFLWRNPRDQWWSYRRDSYFDIANQIILHADPLPAVLTELAERRGWFKASVGSYSEARDEYAKRPLSFADSYLLFYALWCLTQLEAAEHADVFISMDALGQAVSHPQSLGSLESSNENPKESPQESLEKSSETESAATHASYMLRQLAEHGVEGLDFSDATLPLLVFSEQEQAQFAELEDEVFAMLARHGVSDASVAQLRDKTCRYATAHDNQAQTPETERVLAQAVSARKHYLQLMDVASSHCAEAARDIAELNAHWAAARDMLDAARAAQSQLRQNAKGTADTLRLQLAEAKGQAADAQRLAQDRLHIIEELQTALAERDAAIVAANEQVLILRRSLSWRITAPVRLLLKPFAIAAMGPAHWLGMARNTAFAQAARYPKAAAFIDQQLNRVPALKRLVLKTLTGGAEAGTPAAMAAASLSSAAVQLSTDDLSPRALHFYRDLEAMLATHNNTSGRITHSTADNSPDDASSQKSSGNTNSNSNSNKDSNEASH